MKSAVRARLPAKLSQPMLPNRQRTSDAAQTLRHSKPNRRQMDRSKANAPHPLPPPRATHQRQQQPEHHKRHEGEVNDDDKISSQSVECGHVTQETAVAADIPVLRSRGVR